VRETGKKTMHVPRHTEENGDNVQIYRRVKNWDHLPSSGEDRRYTCLYLLFTGD
jgi:hypothetical protein